MARSASGDGFSPSRSSRASTKRSIGLRAHFSLRTAGSAGRCGGRNAQCRSHFAPCSIHLRMVAICASVSVVPACGRRHAGRRLAALMRANRRLFAGSPGVMMR